VPEAREPEDRGPAPPARTARAEPIRARSLTVGVALLIGLIVGPMLGRWIGGHVPSLSWLSSKPATVTHDLVLEQVRSVAKLVASEATIRDVVTYENTYLGSTKRTLIVVTGKVSAGIDLSKGAEVDVDERGKRIAVSIPAAQVLGVEVLQMRTYDERAGLWNPFQPADRDAINAQVRAQLLRAGTESGLAEHANRSAKATLETLLARDGYTVDVTVRGTVAEAGR
jgi:Protein of unknown function (DUF4230)